MSDLSTERYRAHAEVLGRARAGTLTGPERAALVVLLDRLLIAVLLDEDEGGVTASASQHVLDAYRSLTAVECAPAPPPRVGGADVRPAAGTMTDMADSIEDDLSLAEHGDGHERRFPVTESGPVMATEEQRAYWAERLRQRVTALRVETRNLATAATSHRTDEGDQIAAAARAAVAELAAVDPNAR